MNITKSLSATLLLTASILANKGIAADGPVLNTNLLTTASAPFSRLSGLSASGHSISPRRDPVSENAFQVENERRQKALNELLLTEGTYGAGLSEAYADYGRFLFNNGQHSEAAEFFNQAWQVSRIHTGLFSEAQLPFIAYQIEALSQLQDWEQVNELHQLAFLISSRVFPPDDLRFLIAVEFYADWQRNALYSDSLRIPGMTKIEKAQKLSAFYNESLFRLEVAGSVPQENLLNLVAGKLETDLSLAKTLVGQGTLAANLGNINSETLCHDTEDQYGEPIRVCKQYGVDGTLLSPTTSSGLNYALGRYLDQIDASAQRLRSIVAAADELSLPEREWINSLLAAFEMESQTLLESVRRL